MGLDTVLRSSLVLAVGFALVVGLRRQPAALRHWILAASIILAAVQPALTRTLPSWTISPSWIDSAVSAGPAAPLVSTMASFEVINEQPRSQQPARTATAIVLTIWMAGAALGLATLLCGIVWLVWLGRGSTPAGAIWSTAAARARTAIGLRSPIRIRVTRHPALLVTWGAIHPVILLPSDADSWPAERVDLVLAHEMAHLARHDWLLQLAAETVRAIHWFNPLFWIACARLRQESEHASDDVVLDLGFARTSYAAHLVDLARAFSAHGRTWLPAPSIARPSTLERRVRAMLNPHVNRRPVPPTRRIALVAVLLAAALPIAAASQAPATSSGTVVDPSGLPLPNAIVRLMPAAGGAAFQATTDSTGSFQFPAIPSGEYMLSARYPGFAPQRERVQITGATTLSLQLQVGTLSETVSVRGGPGPAEASSPSAALPMPAPPPCGVTSVGGNLKPPRKLLDVRPRYKQALVDAGVQGSVLLQARIGTDGKIRSVEVVSPSHPELEDEALAAVGQWEFSPTYLNCEAVEVRMFVTVLFTVER